MALPLGYQLTKHSYPDHYREVAAQVDSNALVPSGTGDAGCFREVAALHSDHLRQVPLHI